MDDEIKKNYDAYVKEVTPTTSLWKNMFHAFLIGGLICLIGQGFVELFQYLGADKETAGHYEMLLLVLTAVILTGFGIYPKLAKYAGAGTLVPITGFANSVASPAIEFKKEGQIFGVGCRIFSIAGPVILFGILSSWILGLIYWFATCVL
jgi:stage V sporulation protein AC